MRIVIPGKPIHQERPRISKTKFGKPYLYDPSTCGKAKTKLAILPQIPPNLSAPLTDNLKQLRIEFYFPTPVLYKTEQNRACWGMEKKNTKPDLDNLAKYYLDCGNNLLWTDDAVIQSLQLSKHYSKNPRTVMQFDYEQPPSEPAKRILRHLNPQQLQEFLDYAWQLLELTEDGCENLDNESLDKAAALIGIMSNSSLQWMEKISNEMKRLEKKNDSLRGT